MTKKNKGLADFSIFSLALEPVAALSVSGIKIIEGVPHGFFKKDILRVGEYTHPTEGWKLSVTTEKLKAYKDAFDRMCLNGVKVESPIDHSASAADNLGYVNEMFIEPDADGVPTLYGIHEFIGQKSIDTAMKCPRVSATIHRAFKDGKGVEYGEAIINSSVVQQPIVPGQGDFIPVSIAASVYGAASKIPVLCFNLSGANEMNEKLLAEIQALLGVTEPLTELTVVDAISAKMKAIAADAETVKAEADKKMSAIPAKLDPNITAQLVELAEQKLSMLVEKGKITPAVQKELATILIGEQGSRNEICLSFGSDGKKSMLSLVVDALAKNDVIELGTKTGIQSMHRTETDASVKELDDTTKKMAGMVNPASAK
jgi:hypothetical protein